MEELKPCPFCGGKGKHSADKINGFWYGFAKCENDCTGFMLIKSWNTRHTTPVESEELKCTCPKNKNELAGSLCPVHEMPVESKECKHIGYDWEKLICKKCGNYILPKDFYIKPKQVGYSSDREEEIEELSKVLISARKGHPDWAREIAVIVINAGYSRSPKTEMVALDEKEVLKCLHIGMTRKQIARVICQRFGYSKNDTLSAELQVIKDMCEYESEVRKTCSKYLTHHECYGDSYGVPVISEVVELLCAKFTLPRSVPSEDDLYHQILLYFCNENIDAGMIDARKLAKALSLLRSSERSGVSEKDITEIIMNEFVYYPQDVEGQTKHRNLCNRISKAIKTLLESKGIA